MGQFSWLDCKTGWQILDDVKRNVYVLVPKEFGGGHIKETCYDGYGRFGGHDIYELVARWNRWYLEADHVFPHAIERYKFVKEYQKTNPSYEEAIKFKASEFKWYSAYTTESLDEEGIEYVTGYKMREIGIAIACYDEDNASLKFPIKITHDPDAVYEDCDPSLSDPDQGWKIDDDDDDYWDGEIYDDEEDE